MARTECYRRRVARRRSTRASGRPRPSFALRDGRARQKRVEHATGEPENPVPRAALIDKFVGLAQASLDERAARPS